MILEITQFTFWYAFWNVGSNVQSSLMQPSQRKYTIKVWSSYCVMDHGFDQKVTKWAFFKFWILTGKYLSTLIHLKIDKAGTCYKYSSRWQTIATISSMRVRQSINSSPLAVHISAVPILSTQQHRHYKSFGQCVILDLLFAVVYV